MPNFSFSLSQGKQGEQLVRAALLQKRFVVQDVSDNEAYQRADIDFLILKKGKVASLEVKNDIRSNQTNNIFVEETNYNNFARNYAGWLYYSKADYFCFLQQEHHVAHIIHRNDLISLVESKKYRYVSSCDTKGYIIPICELAQCQSYYALGV